VQLVLRQACTADQVQAAISDIPGDVDAIFIGPDSLVGSLYAKWVNAAIERKLPLTGSSMSHVEASMLISYSYDTVAVGRQAARLADQIFKGIKPANLPVETSDFFVSLNLKTAEAIGLNIPDDILRQAKKVFR
jgi:putative ABC transport system substrate-binding protein